MNNKQNDGFLSFAIVVGALLLFAKTADVMSYFSPTILNDIIGSDVSLIYGIVTAATVEGMILALHFNQKAAHHAPAQWVKWMLILISGICQFYDGTIVTNTLAQQSDTLKIIFQFGVPVIPLLVVIMIVWIGQLPETGKPRKPFVGFKNLPGQFRWLWHGQEPTGNAGNAKPTMSYQSSDNGSRNPEHVNPTNRPPH